jgi:heparan-alpha-glucosaminide N-acetyltransferase
MIPEPAAIPREAGQVEEKSTSPARQRIISIDALRGVVMLVMVFVNDLGDVPDTVVPWWMKHYHGPSGMTFVDVVFPAFLFIVGMSIPFAIGGRLARGESPWRALLHVIERAASLLLIGILMVNGTPDTEKMGWSGPLWETLMFLSVVFAFCVISPPRAFERHSGAFRALAMALRVVGFASLIFLVAAFRNKNGHPMMTLSPFYIHHIWYGILGYIGWAYLLCAIVFLIFRTNLTAILGCAVLMMCLYPANKLGLFDGLWIAKHVNIGVAFGSRAAITAIGLLLGAMLYSTSAGAVAARVRFTLLLTAGCAAAAWLLNGLYGTSKENATPSWALWGCAITAISWLGFYFISDIRPIKYIARPLAVCGQNVLLPYLLAELFAAAGTVFGLDAGYAGLAQTGLAQAIMRAAAVSLLIMGVSVALNRIGFRLKL